MLSTHTVTWISMEETGLHNLGGPHGFKWMALKVELSFPWGRGNSAWELWLQPVPKSSILPFLRACAIILNLPGQPAQLCKPVPADYVSLVTPWLVDLLSSVTAGELPRETLALASVLHEIRKPWHLEAVRHLYCFQQLLSWKEIREADTNGYHKPSQGFPRIHKMLDPGISWQGLFEFFLELRSPSPSESLPSPVLWVFIVNLLVTEFAFIIVTFYFSLRSPRSRPWDKDWSAGSWVQGEHRC